MPVVEEAHQILDLEQVEQVEVELQVLQEQLTQVEVEVEVEIHQVHQQQAVQESLLY
jgi:translation elongation factor P/translation initiation factor 5A